MGRGGTMGVYITGCICTHGLIDQSHFHCSLEHMVTTRALTGPIKRFARFLTAGRMSLLEENSLRANVLAQIKGDKGILLLVIMDEFGRVPLVLNLTEYCNHRVTG
jgi:hypothetical protein